MDLGDADPSKYPRGGGEQFENRSRIQFVISSRTVPEWGMERTGGATSSSSFRVRVRVAGNMHRYSASEASLNGEIRKGKVAQRGRELEFTSGSVRSNFCKGGVRGQFEFEFSWNVSVCRGGSNSVRVRVSWNFNLCRGEFEFSSSFS